MQYAMLIYIDPEASNGVSEEQARAITAEYMELRAKPGMFGGGHLRPVDTATTVRVVDSKPLITDGPFADTKEVFGGFYLFEADDLDAALEIAKQVPAARQGGGVEIRPMMP